MSVKQEELSERYLILRDHKSFDRKSAEVERHELEFSKLYGIQINELNARLDSTFPKVRHVSGKVGEDNE